MQLKIDLHVHTDASNDGVSTIYEIIRSAKSKGLDGVAITDHDVPMTDEEAIKISKETDFLVIPGVEISTASGHLVVLRPRRAFPTNPQFLETVKNAVSDGSVVIIPHPTDPLSHGVGEEAVRSVLSFSLPLEVMNASTLRRHNRSAIELAELLALPKVGGSDAHVDTAVGDAYTIVDAGARSVEAVLEALKSGRTSAHGTQTSITTMLGMRWKRLSKRAKLKKARDEVPS
ncbi:MAG: PHP domain-containing protein [Candidatus Verstraetearchaeota archaeon]|nr:PHP domain-containing protein [Candidatus Verstraetearchaeota archaeon]